MPPSEETGCQLRYCRARCDLRRPERFALPQRCALAKNWVSRRFGEETGSQILISLPIPFGAYLLAEHLHCSGILAAVAAGITMSYVEQSGQALAITRVRRSAVWDTVQFTANGMIFVLLGEQLPQIVTGAAQAVRETGHHEPVWLLIYVIAINCALAALRFLWVWTSLRFTLLRAGHRRHSLVARVTPSKRGRGVLGDRCTIRTKPMHSHGILSLIEIRRRVTSLASAGSSCALASHHEAQRKPAFLPRRSVILRHPMTPSRTNGISCTRAVCAGSKRANAACALIATMWQTISSAPFDQDLA
jgi:Sodium/hydrogen exchanger family